MLGQFALAAVGKGLIAADRVVDGDEAVAGIEGKARAHARGIAASPIAGIPTQTCTLAAGSLHPDLVVWVPRLLPHKTETVRDGRKEQAWRLLGSFTEPLNAA